MTEAAEPAARRAVPAGNQSSEDVRAHIPGAAEIPGRPTPLRDARRRRRRSTPWSSGPGSPGSTCCIACAGWAFRPGRSRPARRRRDLVLEPLSGRALRRREHAVLLLLLRGAAAGMGLERTLLRPAGNPALRQPRCRPLRPPARHPLRYARHRRRPATKRRSLDRGDGPRRPVTAPICVMATGCLSAARMPDIPGLEPSRATPTTPATGPMAAWTSPASGSA